MDANNATDNIKNTVGVVTDEKDIAKYTGHSCKNPAELKKFKDKFFKEWRCDLSLGEEVYVSSDTTPRRLESGEFIVIHPGEFVLLLTKENLKLDSDVMGFISMRFDYKQKGLINVSGFHVDPNFEGKLIFSAFNAGPRDIILREGDPVFMIFFERMGKCCEKKHPGFEHIPADMVEQIQGKSVTLSSNAQRLERLEMYLKILVGVSLTGIVSFIGYVADKFL